jgi:hypothetical protein
VTFTTVEEHSAVLCGIAFMCEEPIAALVFAALTGGSIVVA